MSDPVTFDLVVWAYFLSTCHAYGFHRRRDGGKMMESESILMGIGMFSYARHHYTRPISLLIVCVSVSSLILVLLSIDYCSIIGVIENIRRS